MPISKCKLQPIRVEKIWHRSSALIYELFKSILDDNGPVLYSKRLMIFYSTQDFNTGLDCSILCEGVIIFTSRLTDYTTVSVMTVFKIYGDCGDGIVFCNAVVYIMKVVGHEYINSEWWLIFINLSKISLKTVSFYSISSCSGHGRVVPEQLFLEKVM